MASDRNRIQIATAARPSGKQVPQFVDANLTALGAARFGEPLAHLAVFVAQCEAAQTTLLGSPDLSALDDVIPQASGIDLNGHLASPENAVR